LRVEEQRAPHRLTHAFVEACEEAGIPRNPDFNGPEQEGAGLYQVTQRNGQRCSTAAGFLEPALARKNLGVRTGAQALRMLFDGTQAVGVEYLHEGDAKVASCTREVILCGGAVNSPQLLLLSGVGPAAQLEAHGIPVVTDAAGVGENLQDHLVVPVLCDTVHADTLDDAETFWNALRYMVTRGGPMTSNLAEGGAFVRTRPELDVPDVQFHFVPGLWSETPRGKMTGHGVSLGVTQLRPASRGRIVLRSAEPLEPPAIEARYLTAEEDRAVLLAGVRMARRILGARPLARHLAEERLPGAAVQSDSELLAYIAAHAHTMYHPVGTCRMGPVAEIRAPDGRAIPADPMAVVDAELRVRGTQGLRVADASIMPALIGGNTNAPVLAIAEKLAALLTQGSRA
jgi:choline dehydrogenase